jgi:hypothetical protein
MTGTSWGAAVAEERRVMSRMTKMDGERILLDREGSQRSVETRFFEWKGEERSVLGSRHRVWKEGKGLKGCRQRAKDNCKDFSALKY